MNKIMDQWTIVIAQLLPQTDLFFKSGMLMFKDIMNTLRGVVIQVDTFSLQTAAELRKFPPSPMLLYFIYEKVQ